MSNIKKYTITEWNDNEAIFAVDHDKATIEMFHTINNFWSDAKSRLDDAQGDVVNAVLKMIAQYCFSYQAYHHLNSYGMMRHFGNDDFPDKGVEGYPRLDGSMGILLVHVDKPEFEIDDAVIVKDLAEMPPAPKAIF